MHLVLCFNIRCVREVEVIGYGRLSWSDLVGRCIVEGKVHSPCTKETKSAAGKAPVSPRIVSIDSGGAIGMD